MKLAQKMAINYTRAKLNIIAIVSKRKAAEKAFELFCTPFRKSKKIFESVKGKVGMN